MTGPQATIQLKPEQLEFFQENGFLIVGKITPPEELEWMRQILDRLFASRAGWKRGIQFDMAGVDGDDRPAVLPQILRPVLLAPELQHSQFRANALSVARQLIGPNADFIFDHAILKPKQYGAPTPWHQDEAHNEDPQSDYTQVSVWMPLRDATVENGCMHIIPGSHRRPVMAHRSLNNDPRLHALECVGDFDPRTAVACPVPGGGAMIHHCRTLHSAGANQSDTPRLAYILAFGVQNAPGVRAEPYSWNVAKRTAAQTRADAWVNRGGAIGRKSREVTARMKKLAGLARRAVMKRN